MKSFVNLLFCGALTLLAVSGPVRFVYASCATTPGDLDNTGTLTVTDVQCSILGVLWTQSGLVGPPPSCLVGSPDLFDYDCSGDANVVDILLHVQRVLSQPFNPQLDANGNFCPDLCEDTGCDPSDPASCDDGNACTIDFCDPQTGCVNAAGPGPQIVFVEDFEDGAPGWTTGTLATGANGWMLAKQSGGSAPATFSSTAFGTPNQGSVLGFEHSFLMSPVFDLSNGGTIKFDSWANNEPIAPYDAERVDLSFDGGLSWQVAISPTDPAWLNMGSFQTLAVTVVAAEATATMRIRFVYNTFDGCCGPEDVAGWFIDNVVAKRSGINCDDGDSCTDDLCEPDVGCTNTPVDCDDGDLCTVDVCVPGIGCIGDKNTMEDFENGAPGWTTGIIAGSVVGWTLTTVTGGDTPLDFGTTVFGTPNQGALLGYEHSFLQSPALNLTGGGTISFDSWSNNEIGGIYDLERVAISFDGGVSWQVAIAPTDPVWNNTAIWQTLTINVSAAQGTAMTHIRFVYDTADGCCGPIDAVGWFIDNVGVTGLEQPVDCDDNNICTVDSCDPDSGCVHEMITCEDGNLCTLEECDPTYGCVPAGSVTETFESGALGWTTGIIAGSVVGWKLTTITGGDTPLDFGTTVFGTPNQGALLGYEHSFLQSPALNLTGGGTISFDSWSNNEIGGIYDLERVIISFDGGASWQGAIAPTDPVWNNTAVWQTLTINVSAAQGTAMTHIRFVYDTADGCCGPIDAVGWFIDNVVVTSGNAGLVNCNDYNACLADTCDPAVGCVHTDVDCDKNPSTKDECDPISGCIGGQQK